ncbi:MAG: S-methyl-5'-thioadenosine phosphorylase [bacterium]
MKKAKIADNIEIGILGGSGIYHIDGLEEVRTHSITTPFGKPSAEVVTGVLHGRKLAFLPRHGKGHTISPSEINYRANIYAFKSLGVRRIISLSACGSLQENLRPRDMVFPDQLYDRTRGRISTFFGNGIVGHVGFADPFCSILSDVLYNEATQLGFRTHKGGTYVCIEGPMFSTRAESNVYRQMGFSVIGMTNLTEAKLAREAEICYAGVSLVTDYDVWKVDEEVSIEQIIGNLRANTENVKRLLKTAVSKIPAEADCPCQHALSCAVITSPKAINKRAYNRLKLLIGKYIRKQEKT